MNLKQKFKLTDDHVSTNIQDETVILNHKKGEYYSLNPVGAVVWEYMSKQNATLEVLIEVVLQDFDAEETNVKEDLEALLNELINEGLVEKVE